MYRLRQKVRHTVTDWEIITRLLAADLRLEMNAITDGVCINEDGIIVTDRVEYCEACGHLDTVISMIGNLTGLLMAEAIFNDVKKRIDTDSATLTEAQRARVNEC